jgi:DNA helicase-2/ATP-dependent DNA helicase PcrA
VERIATARGELDAIESVSACVDRFFQTEVAEWDWLEAERRFELTIDGQAVVGQIDLLARRPDGQPVVLDYKATQTTRSLDDDLQLPLYLLACDQLFDDPVRTAGYVYVGDHGPSVDLKTYTDDELETARARLADRLHAAANSDFETYTAGDHCQYCPHRSLPCSNDADLDDTP